MQGLLSSTPLLFLVLTNSAFPETNDLAAAINSFPKVKASAYSPDRAVRSANALIAAGEELSSKAFAEVQRAETNSDQRRIIGERIIYLCRLLYEPRDPTKPLPDPLLGANIGMPYESMPPESWPNLPFAIIGGVPLSVQLGSISVGVRDRPDDYLRYCQSTGTFRTKPFPEATSESVSNALLKLFNSPAWKSLRWEDSGTGWHYKFDESEAKKALWKQQLNMSAGKKAL